MDVVYGIATTLQEKGQNKIWQPGLAHHLRHGIHLCGKMTTQGGIAPTDQHGTNTGFIRCLLEVFAYFPGEITGRGLG